MQSSVSRIDPAVKIAILLAVAWVAWGVAMVLTLGPLLAATPH